MLFFLHFPDFTWLYSTFRFYWAWRPVRIGHFVRDSHRFSCIVSFEIYVWPWGIVIVWKNFRILFVLVHMYWYHSRCIALPLCCFPCQNYYAYALVEITWLIVGNTFAPSFLSFLSCYHFNWGMPNLFIHVCRYWFHVLWHVTQVDTESY